MVVISDVLLGHTKCNALQLLTYLQHIDPQILILNGGLVNPLLFKNSTVQLPEAHQKVILRLQQIAMNGSKVYLVSNLKSEQLKKVNGLSSVYLQHRTTLELHLHNNKYLFMPGDGTSKSVPFNVQKTNWIYSYFSWLFFPHPKTDHQTAQSISVKGSDLLADQIEQSASRLAIEQEFNYIICGKARFPKIVDTNTPSGKATYMNAGDWIDHNTALEFRYKKWSLYKYNYMDYHYVSPRLEVKKGKHKKSSIDMDNTGDYFLKANG